MTQSVRAAGPPGYGDATEGTVGEQDVPDVEPDDEEEPETKSELGNPPSELEKPLDVNRIAEPEEPAGIGVPVDQTE